MSSTQPSAAAQQTDNVAHALAGAGGGLLSMTLTYPLITLSTRAQVESRRLSKQQEVSDPSTSQQAKAAATSTLAAAKHIIRREGIAGLYSGLDSALFGISVTNFVYYYWYEWTRAFFERAAVQAGRASRRLTTWESMIAGALAGSATVLITNPIWVINTRMTAMQGQKDVEQGLHQEKKRKPSTLATVLALLREEGPQALFAGVLPALVLVINPILQYTIFEKLKDVVERRRNRATTATDIFLLGALGKLAATTITYPYITVKSQMHVAKAGNEKKEGMMDSFKRVIGDEGWRGLYKGIGPKVTQSVITAAFLFAFKDALYNASVRARQAVPKAMAK